MKYRSNIREVHMMSVLNAIENSKFLWEGEDEIILQVVN